MRIILVASISMLLSIPLYSTPKLIITLSNPRSCSTLLARSFAARGDFMVFNEPGIPIYYQGVHDPSKLPTLDYSNVLPDVLSQAGLHNCFIKEMSSAGRNYLPNSEHLKDPSCYIIFLVRDPHQAMLSWADKCRNLSGLRASIKISPDHIAYKTSYELYEIIAQQAYNPPYIVLTEDLIADPQATLTKLCAYIGIPFTDACLHWDKLNSVTSFNDICHDKKPPLAILDWHDHAMQSNGFEIPHTYDIDRNGLPSFKEIRDGRMRKEYRQMYYQNLVYYKKFVVLHEQQMQQLSH